MLLKNVECCVSYLLWEHKCKSITFQTLMNAPAFLAKMTVTVPIPMAPIRVTVQMVGEETIVQ
jgi:hypothetical protein